ncbi:MAG: Trm112 family protein [Myxococcota bacterium]|nr:Trm112 family protein [Myxococcota bacterium]
MTARIDPELLRILVCPRCKGELGVRHGEDGAEAWLDCAACALGYPVEDGIPVMLVEEATSLSDPPA